MAKHKIIETENDVKALVKKEYDRAGSWSYAPIQTGMGVHGIPDRIGCVPVTITPEMVGKRVGLFVAVEAKRPGRRGEKNAGATGQQIDILHDILNAGGIAVLVDGQDDADFLRDVLNGLDVYLFDAVDCRAMLDRRVNREK